jgi:hypothetical protein
MKILDANSWVNFPGWQYSIDIVAHISAGIIVVHMTLLEENN